MYNSPPVKYGWVWCKTVDEVKASIVDYRNNPLDRTLLLNIDNDFIEILIFLEQEKIVDNTYTFEIHSIDFVARRTLEKIIRKNGWNII